jgi:hypothetical protein
MLENFAPEVAVPRTDKKPVELIGFASEANLARTDLVSVRPAEEYGSAPPIIALLQARSVAALVALGRLQYLVEQCLARLLDSNKSGT